MAFQQATLDVIYSRKIVSYLNLKAIYLKLLQIGTKYNRSKNYFLAVVSQYCVFYNVTFISRPHGSINTVLEVLKSFTFKNHFFQTRTTKEHEVCLECASSELSDNKDPKFHETKGSTDPPMNFQGNIFFWFTTRSKRHP